MLQPNAMTSTARLHRIQFLDEGLRIAKKSAIPEVKRSAVRLWPAACLAGQLLGISDLA